MVELNFTFVIFTASFIVFIGLMKLVFFDSIKRVIDERESFVEKNILASREAQKKIEKKIAESDASSILMKARQEAQELLGKAIEGANNKRSKMVGDAIIVNKDLISRNIIILEKEEREISKNLSTYIKEVSQTAINQLMSEIESKQKAAV